MLNLRVTFVTRILVNNLINSFKNVNIFIVLYLILSYNKIAKK